MAKVRLPSLLVRVFWVVMQYYEPPSTPVGSGSLFFPFLSFLLFRPTSIPNPTAPLFSDSLEDDLIAEILASMLKSLCKRLVIIRELIESHAIDELVNMLVYQCPPSTETWRERYGNLASTTFALCS